MLAVLPAVLAVSTARIRPVGLRAARNVPAHGDRRAAAHGGDPAGEARPGLDQDGPVKWTRAVHHLRDLAEKCAELEDRPNPIHRLRVVALWAVGDILDRARDIDRVTVALAVDLPADDVPWLSEPIGAEHWSNATRLSRSPITALWRSTRVPVWNHRIDRPALVWDVEEGLAEDVLSALAEGRGDQVRTAAPSADDLRARLADELASSLRALRERTRAYEDKRWQPGKLEPVADTLWRAGEGYLDVLDAVTRSTPDATPRP
ncbi:hypothetical protein ABZ816_08635 [Actinosynnema sp. NPDC047251]|uniref:DUF7711 family protein n=1 Tax=Saccharothrix espanaensis TaxID=103731 RepID=UPI0003029BFA|nr:hypothetical protein [Saccharothrix espanaensis]